MDSPTAFIRKEIVDALDDAQDSGDTVEVHPRAASPRRPLLTSKSFEDPRKLPAPPPIEPGLSNISSLTSAEIDDPELLILASKTAPPPFLAKQAARRASAPSKSLTDLAAAAKRIPRPVEAPLRAVTDVRARSAPRDGGLLLVARRRSCIAARRS